MSQEQEFEVVMSRKRWESVKVRVTAVSKKKAEAAARALEDKGDLDWNCGDAEDDMIVEVYGEEPHRFRNFYRCPEDGTEWDDTWSCQCNDQCPTCGMKDITPYRSEDL